MYLTQQIQNLHWAFQPMTAYQSSEPSKTKEGITRLSAAKFQYSCLQMGVCN